MATIDNLSIQVTSSVDNAIDAINRLASRLQYIQSIASRFSMSGVVTEFNNVENSASSAATAVNRLARAFNSLNRAVNGFNGRGFSSTMQSATQDADNATNALVRFTTAIGTAQNVYNRAFSGMTNRSIPLLTGQTEPIYTEYVDNIDDYTEASERAVDASNGFIERLRSCLNATDDFGKSLKVLNSVLSGFSKVSRVGFGSLIKGFTTLPKLIGGSLINSVKGAIASFNGLFASIQRIAFYRAIRAAIKYITAGFKEGLENLYAWSNQADKTFARTMDSLATSSQYLKNSLAAMAAPLIETLAPAIDFVVGKLVDMFNVVNQFFARLSGAKTYTAAKKVAAVWDDASKKTTNSVKKASAELKKTILAFDEINKLNDPNKSSSSGGGGSSGSTPKDVSNMFEIRPITDSIDGVMEKLKGIWNVFKQAWAQEGAATVSAAKAAFNSLKGAAVDIGNTFYDVFTAGYGFQWVTSGLHLLQSMLGVVRSISESFRSAWNDDDRGYEYIVSLFSMLTNVNELIASINRSFDEAFSSSVGQEIWEHILEIATNLNNMVGNVATSINKAWNVAGLGTAIWASLFTIVNSVLDTVNGITKSVADWAADLDFEPVLDSFNQLLGAIEPVVDIIGGALLWAYQNVLLPISKWTIEKGLPKVIDLLGAAFNVLSSALETLKEPAQYIWDNFLVPVGKWVADTAIAAIDGLKNALSGISTWIDEHKEAFGTITSAIGSFIGAWLGATGLEAIISGIATAVEALSTALPLLAAGFSPVKLAIVGVILAGSWLISHWDLVKEAWESVKEKFQTVADAFATIVNDIKTGASAAWADIVGAVTNFGTSITTAAASIQTTLATIWADVKTGASASWKWLKDGLSGLVTWVKTTFVSTWRSAWNSVITVFGNLFAKIKQKVKDPINGAIKLINDMIGAIEGGINTIIGGINSALVITIPDFGVYDPWGNFWGIHGTTLDPPDIPTVKWDRIQPLAKGGILTQPTYLRRDVLAGEAGREAVLPLDTNTEWMDDLAAKVRGSTDDNYMLAEYVRSGVQEATAREIDLLREQNSILKKLLDKPMTAEITTNGIVQALQRKNMRDGTTVVPVYG
jgi:phage-related protein